MADLLTIETMLTYKIHLAAAACWTYTGSGGVSMEDFDWSANMSGGLERSTSSLLGLSDLINPSKSLSLTG